MPKLFPSNTVQVRRFVWWLPRFQGVFLSNECLNKQSRSPPADLQIPNVQTDELWWWQSDIQDASVLQPSVTMKSDVIIAICLIRDVICCPETLSALSFPRSSQQQMFSIKPNNRADICIYRSSSGRLVRRWTDYDWLLSCGLNKRSFPFSDVSMLVNGIHSVTHFSFYPAYLFCFVFTSERN